MAMSNTMGRMSSGLKGAPDWTCIFQHRPDLQPPGYLKTLEDIKKRPFVDPKERTLLLKHELSEARKRATRGGG